ncbi:hypothetical protein EDC04DRAFT_2900793 [Pisolithus marmoratus]|nr:hypothetical protein EDC04DRAFT_2900793 [Pisolithus marmoratus]
MPSSSTASASTISTSRRILPEAKPPQWARPRLHSESPGMVMLSKIGLIGRRVMFTSHLSPYFSQHPSVVKRFHDLITLFDWKEESTLDRVGMINMPPAANKYKTVVNIIKEMWDGIKPELDGLPSKEEIEKAQKEILALLDRGHIEGLLLGSWAGPLQFQSQMKKRSRDDDGQD